MKTVRKNHIREARLSEEDQPVLSSIEEIIADVKAGRPVVIVDDEDRENEGDLIIAAEKATAENINFMAKEGRGLICLPMESAMVRRLGLELMGRGDNKRHKTAFTVSIEAKEGVTTGISAADRAHTILTAINPESSAKDIATPGHVFPLKARDGGVLVRAGHTEAAVDLAKLAGFSGAGVICEVMNDDGTMARLPDLVAYAQKHALKIGTIADLISYRLRAERFVKRIHEDTYTTTRGEEFKLYLYANTVHYQEHLVLVKGDIEQANDPVPVRMHAVDIMGDILGADENSSLHRAIKIIEKEGLGVIVLLRNTKPDYLSAKLSGKSISQDHGGSLRHYGIGAQILRDLGVTNMTLLSNTEKNVAGLDGYGLHISGYRSLDEI